MTREEARKFLNYTKVYVNGKSAEIQEKLLSLGFVWSDGTRKVLSPTYPFLFISGGLISRGDSMTAFINNELREVTAEDILNITIDKPKYRPFKDAAECWQEMKKHELFGWIVDATSYHLITSINHSYIWISHKIYYAFGEAIDTFTFADGTPFGIKMD